MIAAGKAKRAGLLGTQGIRGGENRKVLDRIKNTGDIFWAQSDREWILDGATVHISMVGFDDGSEREKALNELTVSRINADLTSDLDIAAALPLAENHGIAFQGPVKVGKFDIDDETATRLLTQANPNGRPNADVIKPLLNGSDITGRSRGMWLIDFAELDIHDAALYEGPFEYLKKHVKPIRDKNRDRQRRTYWWHLGRSGSDLLEAKHGKGRIILTPRVSKHRIFVWANVEVAPDSAVVAFARDDDYFFGVVHSRVHELWARRQGTQLREIESGFRYTPKSTFETFPLPWSPAMEPTNDSRVEAIAAAARGLVAKRDAWLKRRSNSAEELKKRTLTNLYNENPTWLQDAHRELDHAVLEAYGWPTNVSDTGILARLFKLNANRFEQQEMPLKFEPEQAPKKVAASVRPDTERRKIN